MTERPPPPPVPPYPPHRTSLTVKLDVDVRDYLEHLARRRGLPLAGLVRIALREWCQPRQFVRGGRARPR